MEQLNIENGVRVNAAQKAVRILSAAGFRFRVQGFGLDFGDLPVEAAKAPRKRTHKNKGMVAHYGPKMESLKPGEIVQITVPDAYEVDDFRKAVCAWACTHWGKKAAMSSTTGRVIEVLRIE